MNRITLATLSTDRLRMPNELATLFDRYCSDKGTFWQSRHHYASAYHSILDPIRADVKTLLEIGIGEDTAPSISSWIRYFPRAHIHAVDIKDPEEFAERASPGGATSKLIAYRAQFGCEYDADMWKNPRAHLHLGVDASNAEQLTKAPIPSEFDVIIDDGSHRVGDQARTLEALWPFLAEGGIYIVEDLLVGSLPWSKEHARDAPTNNTRCGNECFFPQVPAEHPPLFDRFNRVKNRRGLRLSAPVQQILGENDWFWTITGLHVGGGVDASLVIRRNGNLSANNRGENQCLCIRASWLLIISMIAFVVYLTKRSRIQRYGYERLAGRA